MAPLRLPESPRRHRICASTYAPLRGISFPPCAPIPTTCPSGLNAKLRGPALVHKAGYGHSMTCTGSLVVYLICSMANVELTSFSFAAAISFL